MHFLSYSVGSNKEEFSKGPGSSMPILLMPASAYPNVMNWSGTQLSSEADTKVCVFIAEEDREETLREGFSIDLLAHKIGILLAQRGFLSYEIDQ